MFEDGVWRTVAGRRIFIKNGQSLTDAMKNSGKFEKDSLQKRLKKQLEKSNIKKFEDKIRNNETEIIGVFDENGKLILEKTSNEKSMVNISIEEGKKLANKTLTHNHPSGYTFSSEDVDTAFKKGLREIKAVHSNGEYSLRRNFEIGEEIPENYFDFSKDYNEAVNNYAKTTVDKIYEKTGNPGRCNKMIDNFRNNWLEKNSDNYGWKYEAKYYE